MDWRQRITASDPIAAGPEVEGKTGPRRISIVGSTGSGKTHLARELSAQLGLPHIELDHVRGSRRAESPGAGENFERAIEEAIAGESWIIDGHYREVRHRIWQRADVVIHLDYPLILIARQLVKRYFQKRSLRSSAQPDATSNGTLETASWRRRLARLTKTLAERREYARVLQGSDYAGINVQRFSNHKAAMAWVRSL